MTIVCVCWLNLWKMDVDLVCWLVLASTNVMEIKMLENDYFKLELNRKVLSLLY